MYRDEQSAPNSEIGVALGQAMQSVAKQSRSSHSDLNQTNSTTVAVRNLWQHPFVDVFKHFKILPVQDWKQNKKQGDVSEVFAKEIGRKAIHINGTISANNFVQIPHPSSIQHTLALTGRYLYLQVKAPLSSTPFSFHIDLTMAERSHGIRISASNLYKKVTTQNGFVMQVPLNLDINRWTVVVFDIYELLKHSRLLPSTYLIEGSYQIKSLTLCANSQVRGVFTSDNLYDFVTLPPDMRFKFQFEIQRWPEFFAWLELPQELDDHKTEKRLAEDRLEQARAKAALKAHAQYQHLSNDQLQGMQMEIDNLLTHQKQMTSGKQEEFYQVDKKARYNAMQAEMEAILGKKGGHAGEDLLTVDERLGFGISEKRFDQKTQGSQLSNYHGGQFIGAEIKRSPKLNMDPIMELKHIIGYSPSSCLNLKWSKLAHENIVVFSSAGVLISMDVETLQQKRFFFGHSSPISCFDIAPHGALIASAQEGKNSIIRIWDYHTARCLSMLPMPVVTMKCLSFSPDGRFLASVGKDAHNKELIVVWDISRIHRNEKPEILAKQTSDFNILSLKFSPIDNFRLVSCGKENIRFWRIKETGNIRGSAVVLNQHARNTVFTCLDFEHGARAAMTPGSNADSRENEALKRVYCATKNGMVFQVNYATETLEATYKTNDSSIYSIAVNEAFCVTGSEDKFLRVWPLDFSEFVMEAKHEGTVCSVDISADGLRVVCGTLYGSLGVLDKSNQRYRTLIRAHTDQILSMDFHLALRNIITVSLDGTIRLWDLQNFEQVIEFNSPLELPLCVAAHPTLPLFSCGFQTGTMRVFDAEKTCVASDFTQFNKAIRALAYSQTGDLLVTCCEDGSFAVHNARRQHLPTKMVHLEFPPQFVHVAFSPEIVRQKLNLYKTHEQSAIHLENQSSQMDVSESEPNQHESERISEVDGAEFQNYYESLFAVMGEYGNSVMIYSSDSVILRHQIQVGTVIRSFQFSSNGRELIVVTKDQRIRFYNLSRFDGVYIKELCTVHRGAVRSTDLSHNGGFMLTSGEDNLLKIWDYDAQTTTPTHFQAFIGHTYPVFKTLFNPLDNHMIFSAGERDGIFVWQFHGDTHTNFHPHVEEDEMQQTAFSMQIDRDALHEPTVLEKMRAKVQERRKPKLAEFSFVLPEFKDLREHTWPKLPLPCEYPQDHFDLYVNKKRQQEELTCNHFVSLKQESGITTQFDRVVPSYLGGDESRTIEPQIVNGYDGFGGVHDNLIWNSMFGNIIYTLNNKVIIEQTKTREQTVLAVSTVRLSCLAQSANGKLLAAAEGEANDQGQSFIYLIDLAEKRLRKTLVFHQKGIQSVAFAFKDKLLISVGVKEAHCLVLHSVEHGNSIRPKNQRTHSTNKIIVQEDIKDDTLVRWATVGTKGNVTLWEIKFDNQCDPDDEIREDFPNTEVEFGVMKMPTLELQESDFLTGAYKSDILLLGCSDGTVCAFDEKIEGFLENGRKVLIDKPQMQITNISVRQNTVVVTNNAGNVLLYTIPAGINPSVLPPEDTDKISSTKLAGVVTAISMDERNEEGMIGTSLGKIFYVCLKENKEKKQEKVQVQLVSKVSGSLENLNIVRFDTSNPKVFLSNCGPDRGSVKLLSSMTMDTVFTFPEYQQLGPVRFITSSRDRKTSQRMIGYANGIIRFISLNDLKDITYYKIELQPDEELTAACYSGNGSNWALGTSFGSVILGATKRGLFREPDGFISTRVDGLMKDNTFAVTSIQLSDFTPDGKMLVSFANGEVKLWKSFIPGDRKPKYEQSSSNDASRKGRRSMKREKIFDIADIGITKFDIHDIFNMFHDPHGHGEEEEQVDVQELYGGKHYPDTQASFDLSGSASTELYFSCTSALQYIYHRNFELKEVLRRIPLLHFPVQMRLIDCSKMPKTDSQEKPMSYSDLDTLICVGTKEGKVLVFDNSKCLLKTKGAVLFGEVRGLSVQADGNLMVAASSSGELASFNLLKAFE